MNQGNLGNKVDKIFDTVISFPKRLVEAIHDEIIHNETRRETRSLACVYEGTLNFDLIEKDVKEIQNDLKSNDNRVLGSRLILDNKKKLMEIRTYTERDNKTYLSTTKIEVKQIANAPEDVLNELEDRGWIELSLKL